MSENAIGGGKKRGVENLTNDTPPKKGFWTPLVRYVFHPPSGVSALFFLYKNPRQSRPEALLEGSKTFRGSALSGTFSSPHTFCTPPYHGSCQMVAQVKVEDEEDLHEDRVACAQRLPLSPQALPTGSISQRILSCGCVFFTFTVEVFLLTVRLFYLRWGKRK